MLTMSSSSTSRMSTRVLLLRRRLSAFYVWRAALQVRRFSRSASSGLEFAHALTFFHFWDSDLSYPSMPCTGHVALYRLQQTFMVLSAGRRRGLRFSSQPIVRLRVLSVRCSSSVGCCFALTTSPLSTCPQLSFLKGQSGIWLRLNSLHVGSHPLAPGDASCFLAYVAVLDLFRVQKCA